MADQRAKRSKLLDSLKQSIAKGYLETTVTLLGHEFKLRTLSEDDEVWADAFLRSTTPMAMISSRKAPRLAAAIVAIDGTPAAELFEYPDDMPKETRAALDENPIQKRYWVYDQMLYFLSEDANRPFIAKLFSSYEELEKKQEEAIKQLPNS